MSGILYGIGVGPGDPELLTIKAVKAITGCDMVILPTEPKEECYAYQIIRQAVPEVDQKEILCLHFPMTRDQKALEEAHERIYRELAGYLEAGHKIAFLTIGDPSLYSTFGYIQCKARIEGLATRVIAGVPSICAVAGRLGIPLGDSKDEIHIVPGSGNISESLTYPGTKVYMKSGRQLARLKQELEASPEQYEVWAVANCGLPHERCMTGIEELDTASGYLTIVIVKNR